MVYMILLGSFITITYFFISKKINAYVNGLFLISAQLIIFNVIFPIIFQLNNKDKPFKYEYILIYYGFYFFSIAVGYYLAVKRRIMVKISFNDSERNIKTVNAIVLSAIILFVIIIISRIDIQYIKNPRLLYEKTRIGYGYVYFILAMLINIYMIISMFTKKKYYYLVFVLLLFYFTGSKARLLIPIELFILYYFYVKKKERKSIKKIFVSGLALILLFYTVFLLTSRYLPNKNISTVLVSMSNYSDYNRNFLILIDKMELIKNYFYGRISFENNFYSFIPRILMENKPKIFGSFRLSYMIFPEWTLLFQGAPSFGQFGNLFADFGHFSLIGIIIGNFIIGGLIGISENMLIKHYNISTFMYFVLFQGIYLIDVGIQASSILFFNVFLVYVLSRMFNKNNWVISNFYKILFKISTLGSKIK